MLAVKLFATLIYLVAAAFSQSPVSRGGGSAHSQIYGETDLIQNPTDTTVPTFDITDCSNESPIVATTSAAHGVADGEWVVIEDVTGNTACNGFFEAASITATTLDLVGSTGNGAYVANGVLGEFFPIEGTWTDGDLSGFTGSSAGVLTYTAIPSVHMFMLHTTSSTPATDPGNPICHFAVFHNGDILLDTIASRNMPTTANIGDVVGEGLLQLTTGDTLQLLIGCIEPSGAVSYDVSVDHGTLIAIGF